jgi:hypothetical protein
MQSFKDKIKKEAGFNENDEFDEDFDGESGEESKDDELDEEEEKTYEEMQIKGDDLLVSIV